MESPNEKDKRSKKARELLQYLENNKQGLLPYDRQGVAIPEPGEGIVYKHMGVQESQNCTVITLRMKHRRMRWSVAGANNLAKALYRRENRDLVRTIEQYTDGLVFTMQMKQVIESTKEGWKRKPLCGPGKPTHAAAGGNADGMCRIKGKRSPVWR